MPKSKKVPRRPRSAARAPAETPHQYVAVNGSQSVCRDCGMLRFRQDGATLFHRDTLREEGSCDGNWPFSWLPELRQSHGRQARRA